MEANFFTNCPTFRIQPLLIAVVVINTVSNVFALFIREGFPIRPIADVRWSYYYGGAQH